MKLSFGIKVIILFLMVFSFAGKNYAQSDFEGKITFKVSDGDASHTMDYYTKGSKIRFDTNESGQMIWDMSARQFIVIMPQQKMYMVMSIPESKMKNNISEETNRDAKFIKTGETKKILGYTAEKFIYKDDENQGETWMTKELGAFKLFDNPMQNDKNMAQWQKDFNLAGYFPMEVTENGKKVFEMTGVDKKSLDDSMFEAPADYKKMDMPMMQK